MVEISCCCLQHHDNNANLIIRSKWCCCIKANDEWQRSSNKSARLPPPSTAASSKVNCAINKILPLIATIACPNIMNDNIKISFIFAKAFSSSIQKGKELSHKKRSWVFKCLLRYEGSRRRNFYFTFLFISISRSQFDGKVFFICGMKIALILSLAHNFYIVVIIINIFGAIHRAVLCWPSVCTQNTFLSPKLHSSEPLKWASVKRCFIDARSGLWRHFLRIIVCEEKSQRKKKFQRARIFHGQ